VHARAHYKHLVPIPEEVLRKVGWSPAEELEWVISGNFLILKSVGEEESKG